MTATDPESRIRHYVEACDGRLARPSDPARVTRISTALQPLLALGDRLGPWPDTLPAGTGESSEG